MNPKAAARMVICRVDTGKPAMLMVLKVNWMERAGHWDRIGAGARLWRKMEGADGAD